jgi:hypothetical protein
MNLFTRMRDLAFQDATLNAIFGPTFDVNKFRVFDRQLPQGQIANGTCAVVQTVSQVTTNLHTAPMRNPLTQERVQISIVDPKPAKASDAATAVCNFLDTANFWQNGAFASPRRTDPGGQNVKLNQRGAFMTYQTDRPIPVEVLDYRIFNVDTA